TVFIAAYREDLFKKAGLKTPDTWEDLYKVGRELKKMGNPVGIPISQNYDTISTGSAVLWCYGAKEVDKDGKTATINSPQTVEVVEWFKKMYRDCMEPEVLSWTDASNNESLQQGKAGWIHNPVSAYIVARDQKLVTADSINHHQSLAGPSGRHDVDAPRSIGIWKFSKNVEPAKEWIRYLLGKKDVYDEYIMSGGGFNQPAFTKLQDHPVLKADPKLAVLRGEGVQYHTYGWPAPASDKVQLITNSFILPNMIAKAVTGTSTKDAIAWALPHCGAGNVHHEDAAGRPFYHFAIAERVYDAVAEAGLLPLVELAFTPRALVPDDAEARFRYEPSPTQWSPYEAGLWSF